MKITSKIKGVEITGRLVDGINRMTQTVHCHECPATTEIVPNGAPFPPEGLFRVIRQRGWSPNKNGKHTCPACQEKARMSKADTPREMTPTDRRAIFREIDGSYDERNTRYVDGITDNTIAKSLDTPRAWVSQVREENFGPSGENTDMERLNQNLIGLNAKLTDAINDALEAAATAEALKAQVEAARGQLDKIKAAVGPYRAA